MNDILNAYLLQHKSIKIPEVGSIYIQSKAAITDFVNKQLFPASFSYRFDKYADVPDNGFYQYIAAKKGITEEEATEWYRNYSANIRSRIKSDGYYELEGIGVFKNDSTGELIFEEQHKLLAVLPPVPAKRVIRKDSKHAILVGDKEKTNVQMSELLHEAVEEPPARKSRWWIYAIILFVIALLLLLFHFYNTGFRWGAAGNQQQINF
jgi:hypothetical protein